MENKKIYRDAKGRAIYVGLKVKFRVNVPLNWRIGNTEEILTITEIETSTNKSKFTINVGHEYFKFFDPLYFTPIYEGTEAILYGT